MTDEHPSPISEGEIEELKRLLEKATPGPWLVDKDNAEGIEIMGHGATLVQIVDYGSIPGERGIAFYEQLTTELRANARLIAAMRNALPRLLSALSRCGRDEAIEEAAKVAKACRDEMFANVDRSSCCAQAAGIICNEIIQRIRSLVSDDKERGSPDV